MRLFWARDYSCLEAGRGWGPETVETSDCSRIMWETRWRVEMCTYLLCVSFSFEGLPWNGNFQDNNVNVYTLYCHRFEHYACILSCWQCKRCYVEQCGAVYLSRLLSFCWKFTLVKSTRLKISKKTMGREYGLLAKQVVEILECFVWLWQKRCNGWGRPTLYFECNSKNIRFWQDTQRSNERSSFP